MKIKVSIIIPYYNQAGYIEETLKSVLDSSYQDFEILIIDDGSNLENKNQLIKIVNKFNDKRILTFQQPNKGPSSARNLGIQNSSGEYLVFLDSDDYLLKNSLKHMIEKIKDNHLIFGDCLYFGEIEGLKKQNLPTNLEILIGNPIAVCCMINRKIIKKINFDSNLDKLGLEDWEFFINIIKNELSISYIPIEFFKIRVHKTSRTFEVANKNKTKAIEYIMSKHSDFLYKSYLELYYEKKQLKELIDLKIGKEILKPYRFIKRVLISLKNKYAKNNFNNR